MSDPCMKKTSQHASTILRKPLHAVLSAERCRLKTVSAETPSDEQDNYSSRTDVSTVVTGMFAEKNKSLSTISDPMRKTRLFDMQPLVDVELAIAKHVRGW